MMALKHVSKAKLWVLKLNVAFSLVVYELGMLEYTEFW